MNDPIKAHFPTLFPGARFRLLDQPDSAAYTVVASKIDHGRTAFLDPDGDVVTRSTIYVRNGNSHYVYTVPAEEGHQS